MKKYKRVYICSPLRADTWSEVLQNMKKAQQFIELAAVKYECRALALHAYLPFVLDDNEPDERALALEFGLRLIDLCDALIVCGDVISEGMRGEIVYAAKLGIPVLTLDNSSTIKSTIQTIIREN